MEREEPEFSWSDAVVPEDVEIRVRDDDGYRTCSVCGGDCVPEAAGADLIGARIAFVCPEHGLHRLIDPFEHLR
ncbi:hypothetical protein MUN77_03485 [Leucobacter allii]|uniref:hypothetical protein n=1 Tax=Leucobacter allii TaxID=2932247 RepID=UPI001FD2BBA5|nr:hypothetical protein [Leucobacter allii]UOR02391.1 hypothetical protein MUN77_03485 [Leucobacter allii]